VIKNEKPWQVFRGNDDYYRFVNHEEKLATTGFRSEQGLLKNAGIIRIDAQTTILMRERYSSIFEVQS
jgi:hypothetical protein